MPRDRFRGDPYRVLDVDPAATDAAIKRRWRELANEHHPDRATTTAEAQTLTRRMARINAAYDLLRDPDRRAEHDASAGVSRDTGRRGRRFEAEEPAPPPAGGPPRPRAERPVTGRFDATGLFVRRNTTTSRGAPPLRGQPPREHASGPAEPLRASAPNGPVVRRASTRGLTLPSLEEARSTPLEFGKFRGHTLGELESFEPTYIDWIAKTITRDRELVLKARVIQAEMDRQGVVRRYRASASGFGRPAADDGDGAGV
jgi:curved DNA-binding protein CbpA